MTLQDRLWVAIVACCCGVELCHGSSGCEDDEEIQSSSNISASGVPEVSAEQRELQLIRRHRDEYENLTRRVAARLRRFQGIPGQRFDGLQSSDVRLTGAQISGLLGESETPSRISLVEEDWIRLAGDIRAAECSNLLLNRIADSREKVPVNARSLLPHDFTLLALCQIGEPACREAFKRIPQEADLRRRQMMVRLLHSVLGKSRARAELVRMQAMISDEAQTERVGLAISQIDNEFSKTEQ